MLKLKIKPWWLFFSPKFWKYKRQVEKTILQSFAINEDVLNNHLERTMIRGTAMLSIHEKNGKIVMKNQETI